MYRFLAAVSLEIVESRPPGGKREEERETETKEFQTTIEGRGGQKVEVEGGGVDMGDMCAGEGMMYVRICVGRRKKEEAMEPMKENHTWEAERVFYSKKRKYTTLILDCLARRTSQINVLAEFVKTQNIHIVLSLGFPL